MKVDNHMGRCWLIFGVLMLGLASCQLPALPEVEDSTPDADMSTLVDLTPRPLICVPNNRTCQNGAVEICSADGRSFNVEACPTNSFCQEGQCEPITNTCQPGEAFSLSTRAVLFDVRDDLKPSVASVLLVNCGMSSLFIRTATIDSPIDENGQEIFAFERSRPQGIELQPGTALEMKVQFRPQRLDLAEAGTLFLNIDAGGDVVQRAIELKSKTWCISTQPRIAMGLVPSSEPVEHKALVYNCGSMPLTIAGVSVLNTLNLSEGESISTEFAKNLEVLVPGQTKTINVTFERKKTGPVYAQMFLNIPEQDAAYLPRFQPHAVTIEGYVYNSDLPCVEQVSTLPDLIDPIIDTAGGDDDLRPMSAHVFSVEQPDPMWLSYIEPVSVPEGAPSLYLMSYPDSEFWFLPYWVGQYTFQQTLIHKISGARSCQTDRFDLRAKPDQPLYVELGWEVEGDPIVGDRGAGMDLDLHVLITREGQPRPQWGWDETDCFFPDSLSWEHQCKTLRAVLTGSSQHGQYPEAFSLEQDEPVKLDFGIHLINKGFFPSVTPRLRVWRYGVAQEVFERIERRPMSSPSSFWFVGNYDLKNNVGASLNQFWPKGLPD